MLIVWGLSSPRLDAEYSPFATGDRFLSSLFLFPALYLAFMLLGIFVIVNANK